MYDVMSENGTYYNREAVKEIAKKLGLIYPHEEMMTIRVAIDFVKKNDHKVFFFQAKNVRGVFSAPPSNSTQILATE